MSHCARDGARRRLAQRIDAASPPRSPRGFPASAGSPGRRRRGARPPESWSRLSGGRDSTALAHLVLRAASRAPGPVRVVAAHLDHGLRPDAEEQARFVESAAAAAGIELVSGRSAVAARAKRERRSLEAAGRLARLDFLAATARDLGIGAVALGHTREDQAETLLLQLARGAGALGLSAMPPARRDERGLLIVRPMLDISREDVAALVRHEGWPTYEDPSNRSPRHTRNRVRSEVLPLLRDVANPRVEAALARTAELLREDDALLARLARERFAELATRIPPSAGSAGSADPPGDREVRIAARDLVALPPALARRVVREALLSVRGNLLRTGFVHVEAALALARGGRGRSSLDLPRSAAATRTGSVENEGEGRRGTTPRTGRLPFAESSHTPAAYNHMPVSLHFGSHSSRGPSLDEATTDMSSTMKNLMFWLVASLVLILFWNVSSRISEQENELSFTQFMQRVEDDRNRRGADHRHRRRQRDHRDRGRRGLVPHVRAGDGRPRRDAAGARHQRRGDRRKRRLVGHDAARLAADPPHRRPLLLPHPQMQAPGNRAMSFGRSRAKLTSNQQKRSRSRTWPGWTRPKEELQEIIDFLREPQKFQRLGGRIPKGVLLMGPPGTGKTLLARAISGEANVPFFTISGSDFVEMFVGVGASRVRDLFEQGKKNAPCIVFIDEIDAVGRAAGAGLGGGHDEREQTLNQLLVEMDGFESSEGVILIASTNRPDVLDPALLRPGRFDRRVVVPLPDIRGREGVLKVHAARIPFRRWSAARVIARGTPGFSGADLANLVNEAALTAARLARKKVRMEDFEGAKDKVLMGAERRSIIITADEKRTTAYHEAGHAVVAALLERADPLHKVSIIPRGMAMGVTNAAPRGRPAYAGSGLRRGDDRREDGGPPRRGDIPRPGHHRRLRRHPQGHRPRPADGLRMGDERGRSDP